MIKFLLTATLFLVVDALSYSQVNESEVKSALIIKFAQMLEWENKSSIEEYNIGLFSNDSVLIKNLSDYSSNRLHSKPIRVFTYEKVKDIKSLQVVFIDYAYRKYTHKVMSIIKSNPTLLITYNEPNPDISMINIYKLKNSSIINFSINRHRLDNSGFVYTKELLLFGGNTEDIKELYLNADKELHEKDLEIDSITNRLSDLKKESALYQNQVDFMSENVFLLTAQIETKEQEVVKKDSDLNQLNSRLLDQQEQLKVLKANLQNKIDSTNIIEAQLKELNSELDKKQLLVANNEIKIAEGKKHIQNQQDKISTQKKVLSYTFIMGFALLVAVISFIIAFRAKYTLANRLKQLVDERTEELYQSRKYYKSLFQNTPVGICEFNFSEVMKTISNFEENNKMSIEDARGEVILNLLKNIRINDANKYAIKLFNATNNEEFMSNLSNLFSNDSVPGLRVLFKNLIQGKEQFEHEISLKSYNNESRYLYLQVIILPADKKSYSKVIISMVDVTKQKMYEQELVKHRNNLEELVEKRAKKIVALNRNLKKTNLELAGTNKQLKEQKEELISTLEQLNNTQAQLVENEKLASLGMLTAGIAHEINNPINFISSGSQALDVVFGDLYTLLNEIISLPADYSSEDIIKLKELTKQIEDEEYNSNITEIIGSIRMGVDRIVAIVNSLQAYTRSSDTPEPYNIEEVIENSLVILKNKYKNSIKIIKNYSDLPPVICVAGKLEQAFINILSNAFDAIKDEGTVAIYTNYNSSNKLVSVVFKDTGEGINTTSLNKIFDPFFTTKESGKGTGLGLYITHSIIKQLNGTIDVESDRNTGTTFKITLPV